MANEYKLSYATNEYKLSYTAKEIEEMLDKLKLIEVPYYESWTFTLEDGSTVTKAVCVNND